MRPLTSVTRVSAFEDNEYVNDMYKALGTEKRLSLYADGDGDRHRIGYGVGQAHQFWERLDYADEADTRRFHCLLMDVAQSYESSDRVLRGLLLEPSETPGQFRRVGCMRFNGPCALKMRYRSEIQYDDGKAWGRLWKDVSPGWDAQRSLGTAEPPKVVSIKGSGPMSLYEFDGEGFVDEGSFEKLKPQIVTLV